MRDFPSIALNKYNKNLTVVAAYTYRGPPGVQVVYKNCIVILYYYHVYTTNGEMDGKMLLE